MSLTTSPSKRLRILIVGGGLSEFNSALSTVTSLWSHNYSSLAGGLALANGLLNAASTAPLDVLVLERDTDEYLRERGGYQIRVSLPCPKG